MMELSKPRNTMDVAFIVAQLEQCERDHRQRGLSTGTVLLACGRYHFKSGADRDGRQPACRPGAGWYPEACVYCSYPLLHDVVQCDRLYWRMLDACDLITKKGNKPKKGMLAADDGGYKTADDEDDYDVPRPAPLLAPMV